MAKLLGAGIAIAVVLASAVGLYRFSRGEPLLSINATRLMPSTAPSAAGRKILYWKAPGGEPDFSAGPKKASDGRDYQPVYDDEESDFQRPNPPVASRSGKVKLDRKSVV